MIEYLKPIQVTLDNNDRLIAKLKARWALRNAHFMEELILYWPSKFFFPFRKSMPMGEKFREIGRAHV